ncbi:transposase [Streptomyces sp. NBC_00239]|uniref:transposase n=1 Tax=Streptomyces sp. NBC_00239 TaxID=2903640 RepID=UPI003FA7EB47
MGCRRRSPRPCWSGRPRSAHTPGPWLADRGRTARQVINGMVCKIRTGLPWRDVPDRNGPWKTVCTPFRRCALSGVLAEALQQIQAQA